MAMLRREGSGVPADAAAAFATCLMLAIAYWTGQMIRAGIALNLMGITLVTVAVHWFR